MAVADVVVAPQVPQPPVADVVAMVPLQVEAEAERAVELPAAVPPVVRRLAVDVVAHLPKVLLRAVAEQVVEQVVARPPRVVDAVLRLLPRRASLLTVYSSLVAAISRWQSNSRITS